MNHISNVELIFYLLHGLLCSCGVKRKRISWSYMHALPSLASCFLSVCLLAMGAHVCEPLPSQRKRHSDKQPEAAAWPFRGKPAQNDQRSAARYAARCAARKRCTASSENDRAASPAADANPPQQKNAVRGRTRTTASPVSLFRQFFCFVIFGVEAWESERESRALSHTARGCDAENPAQGARSAVPAPGARGHALPHFSPASAPRDGQPPPQAPHVRLPALSSLESFSSMWGEATRRKIPQQGVPVVQKTFFSYAWR